MGNEPEEFIDSTGIPEKRVGSGEIYCYNNGTEFGWSDTTCINGYKYVCTGNSFVGKWQLVSPKTKCS